MALSAVEQLEIIRRANTPRGSGSGETIPENGGICPAGLDNGQSLTLYKFIQHQSGIFASSWVENYKQFPLEGDDPENPGTIIPINQLAEAYRSKMINACNQAFRVDGERLVQLTRLWAIVLGGKNFTFAQVQGAQDGAWDNVASVSMLEVFEKMSGVRIEEKAEYDSLQ